MARELQAAQCRLGLDSTLRSVHEFTASATTVSGRLLHRMNAVLSAAVRSNFGAASCDELGDLYESIDREQYRMLTCAEDMPFLFFARSFAVVIEEAVRQLRQANTATVPNSPHNTVSEVSESGKTHLEEKFVGKEKEKDGRKEEERKPMVPPVVAATAAKPEVAAVAAAPAAMRMPQSAVAGTRNAALVEGSEEWRREMQRQRPNWNLDFSDAAIEGRMRLTRIPSTVRFEEIRELLRPFGRLINLHHRPEKGRVTARFESNQAADEAVAQLERKVVHGSEIFAYRTHFLSFPRPPQQLQSNSSCSKAATPTNDLTTSDEKAFCAAFAAAAKAAEHVTDAGINPEREEIVDSDEDLSYDGSNFSVD